MISIEGIKAYAIKTRSSENNIMNDFFGTFLKIKLEVDFEK